MTAGMVPPEICTCLVRAQKAASPVGKDSRNTHHNYPYASAEAIIAESRDALSGSDLAVICSGWTVEDGAPFQRIVVSYLIVHESGVSWAPQPMSTPIIPEDYRPADKAESTALTYNLGYFLRALLLLPRVKSEEEVDQRDDRGYQQPRSNSGGGGRAHTIKFGPGKGKSFRDATADELERFRDAQNTADPKWGEANARTVVAVNAELERRASGQEPPERVIPPDNAGDGWEPPSDAELF